MTGKTPQNKAKLPAMSSVEAQLHSEAIALAKQMSLLARESKKKLIRVALPSSTTPPGRTSHQITSITTPKKTPSEPDLNAMLIDPATPPPLTDRTRRRSPGQTPDLDNKLQRTSPDQNLHNQDETARILDFADKPAPRSPNAAPDPTPPGRHQE